MAQPEYVPTSQDDRVRAGEAIPPAKRWAPSRPGEVVGTPQPEGEGFGNQGPDQGYALFLAKRFADKLELVEGEHRNDVINGCLGVATKRASFSSSSAPLLSCSAISCTSPSSCANRAVCSAT